MRACLGAIALLSIAAITGCGGTSDSSTATASHGAPPTKAAKAPPGSHTVVIVLENKEFGEVIGAADASYLDRLASQGALATNDYAITHPSLPNYLAMTGGSTFGISEDCTDCHASGPSLAT